MWNLFYLEFTRHCSPTDGSNEGGGRRRVKIWHERAQRWYIYACAFKTFPRKSSATRPGTLCPLALLNLPCLWPLSGSYFLLLVWEHNGKHTDAATCQFAIAMFTHSYRKLAKCKRGFTEEPRVLGASVEPAGAFHCCWQSEGNWLAVHHFTVLQGFLSQLFLWKRTIFRLCSVSLECGINTHQHCHRTTAVLVSDAREPRHCVQ